MAKKISVNFRNLETVEFDSGVTLLEISEAFKHYFKFPILIGKVDNHITFLNEQITRSCKVDLFDISSGLGNEVYGRTCQFILVLAVRNLFGNSASLVINNSIDKGFYSTIEGVEITKDKIDELKSEFDKIVAQDYIINKVSVSRYDAIKYFKGKKWYDKVKVLKYISNSYINLYRIDDIYDYFYGELTYRTGLINDIKLTYISGNGFVLSYPSVYNPEFTLDYIHHKRLFETFADYNEWGKVIGVNNAADLNEVISTGKYDEFIRLSETFYNDQLSHVANMINERKDDVKLVLIAGPSSSGKTTTSKKLATSLEAKGFKTHPISIDDYFLDRDKTPVLENGELDTESLNAVDVTLFNKHLSALLAGEEVSLPEYNFMTGKREYNGRKLK